MKIIRMRDGFFHRLWCIFFHRPFYLKDKVGNWYCDACAQNELTALQNWGRKEERKRKVKEANRVM